MKKFIALLLVAVMCLGMVACGKQEAAAPAATAPATTAAPAATTTAPAAPAGPEYDEVTLQIAHVNAVDNACHLAYEKLAEYCKEKSEGKVQIDIYPAGQLYNQDDSYDACMLGDLDMCQADLSGMTAKAPKAGVLSLAMLMPSYEKAAKVFYGEIGDKVNAEIESAYGYHVMGWMWNGFRVMVTNDPIDELADCKGYKLRVPAIDLYLNVFVPMGFTPITTTWGECYSSCQSGLCDGCETTVQAVYQQGFAELCGNVTKTNHILSVIGPCMNIDKWNSLSADTQQLITDGWAEAQQWANDQVTGQEDGFYENMIAEGTNVMDWKNPQELVDLFTPMWAENAKNGGFEDLLAEAQAALK